MSERIRKKDLKPDPMEQFELWFNEAKAKSGLPNPNSMTLCTFSPDGWPEGRPVLLKQHDSRGFVFFTNMQSEKGRSIKALPKAELVFHWDVLGRQIRIRGELAQVSDSEADAYFAFRPKENQIGAWASSQSEIAASWEEMDQRFRNAEQRYAGQEIPRPPYWSGYRLLPNRIEFWKADPHRFHDRFRYYFEAGQWKLVRLYP